MRPNRKEYVVSEEPAGCDKCEKRPTCKAPCAEVERWINQDCVGRNSNLRLQNGPAINPNGGPAHARCNGGPAFSEWLDFVNYIHTPEVDPADVDPDWGAFEKIVRMRLTEKITRFIYSYYVKGRRIRDIAIMEGVSSQTIDQRHIQAKRVVKKKLDMEDAWTSTREMLNYRSISDYDIAWMYFKRKYPRKAIAAISNIHISSVGNRIARLIGSGGESV